ncbi:hypothetical protein Tco_0440135 [Tanacetum coccineum]
MSVVTSLMSLIFRGFPLGLSLGEVDTSKLDHRDKRVTNGRLWEELEADVALANNLLDVLTRYLEQMHGRGPEMLRVELLPADPLISCLHTFQRMTGNDM